MKAKSLILALLTLSPMAMGKSIVCKVIESNRQIQSAGDSMDILFDFDKDDSDKFKVQYRINAKRMHVAWTQIPCKNTFTLTERDGSNQKIVVFCGAERQGEESLIALSISLPPEQNTKVLGQIVTHKGIPPYLKPKSDTAVRCDFLQ